MVKNWSKFVPKNVSIFGFNFGRFWGPFWSQNQSKIDQKIACFIDWRSEWFSWVSSRRFCLFLLQLLLLGAFIFTVKYKFFWRFPILQNIASRLTSQRFFTSQMIKKMIKNGKKIVQKPSKKELQKCDQFGVDFWPQIGSKIDLKNSQKSAPRG